MRFTSVVGYHLNPMTCGVAKFNAELAKRLHVPVCGLADPIGPHPLYSLKASELDQDARWRLYCTYSVLTQRAHPYSVFWHDAGEAFLNEHASVVFYADPSLGPNGLWCPSLLPEPKRRMVRLFSFGMAHKLQTPYYARVRELLDAADLDYHLRVSVGLHEGTSLSDATQHFDALKEILGADKVTILGCLSDDAVAEELGNADCVLSFFEKGLRANNTTVHAAIAARVPVLTNWDAQTPFWMRPATHDICFEDRWRLTPPRSRYDWDSLISEMETIYAKSTNRQPLHL